jgi:hypothetical protein
VRGAWVWPVIVSGVCLVLLAACDLGSTAPTPTPGPDDVVTGPPGTGLTPGPTPEGLSDDDAVRIYQAVIASLLSGEQPTHVYISPNTGRGERLDDADETRPLPEGLLPALQASDTGPEYALLDFAEATGPLEEGGQVQNGGVFLTLGPIEADPEEEGAVAVRGSLYRRVGSAEGLRFRLRPDDTTILGWKVVAATQEWNDNQE